LSDKALSQLASYGIGQQYLAKIRNPLGVNIEKKGAVCEIDLSFLSK